MDLLIAAIIGLVAFLHLYFLWFEMFQWTSMGPKIFRGFPRELFGKTKAMAANQGLYNGFLAAGLIWTFFIDNPNMKWEVSMFFLACVLVAGLYGAYSVSKKIFWVQGLPALAGILLLLFS